MLYPDRYSVYLSVEDIKFRFALQQIIPSVSLRTVIGENNVVAVALSIDSLNRIAKVENSYLTFYVQEQKLETGQWITAPLINMSPKDAIERLDLQERWAF